MMIELKAKHQLRHGILGNADCRAYEAGEQTAIAIVHGRIVPEEEILVRIQSACLYGEVLLATDCDCRAQLNQSLHDVRDAGCGVIIHLDQEGRGAGLVTKARAYQLLDSESLDTVEAYKRMRVEVDSRDYSAAIEILRELGVERVRLITNNPRKIDALKRAGLAVERAKQRVAATDANIDYLRVKASKLGHLLDLPPEPGALADESSFHCTVVGAAVMDHVVKMSQNPTLGRARQASAYRRRPGGKGFNQAVALSRLGASSALVTSRGADSDSLEISEALVAESVRPWFIDASQVRSPQTVVLEPKDSQPTYIGWLTSEHRTLAAQKISRWSAEIGSSDSVLFTLESSPKTIDAVLDVVSSTTLKILTASPAAEDRKVSTWLLEQLDVVIGSEGELLALYGDPEGSSIDDVIQSLTDTCDLTVVVTDLKSVTRTVRGYNKYLPESVTVQSPSVRATDRYAAAVGNGDVFSAAFTLEALRREREQVSEVGHPGWQSAESFFGTGSNLLDVLFESVIVEAWVVKSGGGGYTTFPTREQLKKWPHQAPRILAISDVAEQR